MIYNLYIINEGGVAIYTKNFAKSTMDEQLISGFVLAIGNFAKEAVGSGLKKIEMETGEQLFAYYDFGTKLTAAAITGAKDHPKLVTEILPEILAFFAKHFGDKINSPHIVAEAVKFDPVVEKLLADKTRRRDKKRFIFGLILGTVVLIVVSILTLIPLGVIAQNYQNNIAIASSLPDEAQRLLAILTASAGLFFGLELYLVVLFIPSSFVAGYTAGSRSKGIRMGIVFFFCTAVITLILGFFNVAALLVFAVLIIYLPLALLTSIVLGYLGGLLRDRKKLYPVPPEMKLSSKV